MRHSSRRVNRTIKTNMNAISSFKNRCNKFYELKRLPSMCEDCAIHENQIPPCVRVDSTNGINPSQDPMASFCLIASIICCVISVNDTQSLPKHLMGNCWRSNHHNCGQPPHPSTMVLLRKDFRKYYGAQEAFPKELSMMFTNRRLKGVLLLLFHREYAIKKLFEVLPQMGGYDWIFGGLLKLWFIRSI